MASRSIDQILQEVTSKSDPQRQLIMKQVADIPRQIQAEEQGLEAKRLQANEDILTGSRRRGLGFSGIPVGEQAKYAAQEYAPAVARLRTAGQDRRSTLEAALADIGRSDYTTAQDIYSNERSFLEQQRQFNEQMALQRENAARTAAAAEQNILAKYGIGLGGGSTAQQGVDDEEAEYQAYLRSQEQRAEKRLRSNEGLKVLSGSSGLTTRGGGSIPTNTKFTYKKKLF